MFRYSQPRLPLLMLIGFALLLLIGALLPVSIGDLWRWGAALAGHPLAILGVVLLMAVMLSFGLPGSLLFWIIAPFHAPWLSTCMLLVGSVGGALGAYRVVKRLGDRWRPDKYARQVLRLLGKRSDFFTQCALRMLPGFPHAFINFAGGVLHLPLLAFSLAALLGLGFKWSLYSHAVHGMVSAKQAEQALSVSTMLPLFLVAGLIILGGWIRQRWMRKSQPTD